VGSVIEANQNMSSMVSTSELFAKSDTKGNRELKQFACSINYDVKGGQYNRDKGKGRGPRMINEA
jgi:hypothetical protein